MNSATLTAGHPPFVPRLISRLGEVTREKHQVLNQHPILRCLTRRDLNLSQYRRALQALYALFVPTERRLAEFVAAQGLDFAYEERRRLRDLAADIVYLGGRLPDVSWFGPQISSLPELIGVMYVLEGSRLGGQVIARQLELSIGLSGPAGIGFLTCHGQPVPRLWADFCSFAAVNCPERQFPVAEQAAIGFFADMIMQLDLFMEAGDEA